MTLNNGPLLTVSGSHTGPTFDHHQDGFFAGAIDPTRNQIDFAKAEPLTGKAGSCTFHHARPIHGSATNHSSSSRRLLLFQIATSDAGTYLEWRNLTGKPSRKLFLQENL